MIFKGFINVVYVALSGGTLLISVMSQQYNCLMELYTLFLKMYLPSSFILRYVRAEMNVHAFMNKLDQKDYWNPRKKRRKKWNSMYKVNGELSSCDITLFWQSSIQRGRHTQLCIITSLKWIIQICSNLYCCVCKIAFYLPNPHCCWGNFPFNSVRVWIL